MWNIDDQHRNPNINNRDNLVGRLTTIHDNRKHDKVKFMVPCYWSNITPRVARTDPSWTTTQQLAFLYSETRHFAGKHWKYLYWVQLCNSGTRSQRDRKKSVVWANVKLGCRNWCTATTLRIIFWVWFDLWWLLRQTVWTCCILLFVFSFSFYSANKLSSLSVSTRNQKILHKVHSCSNMWDILV